MQAIKKLEKLKQDIDNNEPKWVLMPAQGVKQMPWGFICSMAKAGLVRTPNEEDKKSLFDLDKKPSPPDNITPIKGKRNGE